MGDNLSPSQHPNADKRNREITESRSVMITGLENTDDKATLMKHLQIKPNYRNSVAKIVYGSSSDKAVMIFRNPVNPRLLRNIFNNLPRDYAFETIKESTVVQVLDIPPVKNYFCAVKLYLANEKRSAGTKVADYYGTPDLTCGYCLIDLKDPEVVYRVCDRKHVITEGKVNRILPYYEHLGLSVNPEDTPRFGSQTFGQNISEHHPTKPDTAAIPAEILRMNDQSIELFKEAMKDGVAKVYNIRVMVVGHLGVGKTTLIKRLLGEEVNIKDQQSTEGIVVHAHCCRVSGDTMKWTLNKEGSEQNLRLQRLAKVLNDKLQKRNATDKREEQVKFNYQREVTGHAGDKDRTDEYNVGQDMPSRSDSDEFLSNRINKAGVIYAKSDTGKVSDDPAMEILKLLRDKADQLKQETDENIHLTMMDFAGQYAFYTTHQAFLTEQAIYLLVSNISKQITDVVQDDCYFDTEGIKLCQVYELVEVWLNSIHSCAPSSKPDTPPVILVGTHVDQIQQDSREEVCKNYFRQIRYEYIGTKPTIVHLADEDFAINNAVIDPKLDKLKQKILQLASKQPYWGMAIPVRWLPLEESLMNLKAAGVKVIPYSLLEKMNQEGAVKIESRDELLLFLKFQHDIGNILYFKSEELKETIMLDPQWLIYSLRSIITAEEFILKKTKTPAVIEMWRQFKKTGKLTQELIDAIWTEENNPDCHDNKKLLLHFMEKLNIIARPMSFSKAGDVVKENYFLAPCMLHETTPREVISPRPSPEMGSSSVLCYVFIEKFLPPPIFHRLLAACVAHWCIAKKKSDNLIFCGCCVFQVDPCHELTLYFRDCVIFARVTKMSKSNKTPDSSVCIGVKEFISDNLSGIIGYLCQSLKFEFCIQCPMSKEYSLDSLIPISRLQSSKELSCYCHEDKHVAVSQDLLKFWFEESRGQPETNIGICEKVLTELSQDLISSDWKFVFRHLKVEDSELDQVGMDHIGNVREQIYQLLRLLNQRGSLNKTNIIRALKKEKKFDLANKYSVLEFSDC